MNLNIYKCLLTVEENKSTFEDDIESPDPLLEINVILTLRVEILEDPVHNDVLGHVQLVMEKLSELFPVNFPSMIITLLDNVVNNYHHHHSLSPSLTRMLACMSDSRSISASVK